MPSRPSAAASPARAPGRRWPAVPSPSRACRCRPAAGRCPGSRRARRARPGDHAIAVAPSRPHVTNYRGLMRVYREWLRAPLSWWLLGLVVIVILGAELAAGFGWLAAAAIYAVLVAGWSAMLISWGRPRVEVADGELVAGGARLALAAAGEVSALDRAQTRAISG